MNKDKKRVYAYAVEYAQNNWITVVLIRVNDVIHGSPLTAGREEERQSGENYCKTPQAVRLITTHADYTRPAHSDENYRVKFAHFYMPLHRKIRLPF